MSSSISAKDEVSEIVRLPRFKASLVAIPVGIIANELVLSIERVSGLGSINEAFSSIISCAISSSLAGSS